MQTISEILEDAVAKTNWSDEEQIIHLTGFLQDLIDHPGLTPGELLTEMLESYLDSVIAEEIGF